MPTLYFSADSDAFVQLCRSISILTGRTMDESARLVLGERVGEVSDRLTGLPIRFNYLASPSLDDMELALDAYDEVYGDYPSLIVVDNITNVRSEMSSEDGDPFSGLEGLLDYLHDMARSTEACLLCLHHVTGPYNDGNKPIPMSGVKGQITRVPEMVLTIHKEAGDDYAPDTLVVSPVKNRGGQPDQTGQNGARLEFDGERMSIRDLRSTAPNPPPGSALRQEDRREVRREMEDPFLG